MKTITIVFMYILALDNILCFDCPQPDGLFADPTDPHYYYNCGAGRPYRVRCNADLVFNTDNQECDFHTASGAPNATTPVVTTISTNATTVAVTSEVTTNAVTTPVITAGPIITTEAPQTTTTPPEVTTIPTTTEKELSTPPPTEVTTSIPTTTPIPITTPPPTEPITTPNPTTEAITTPTPTTVAITTPPPTTEATTVRVEPTTTVEVTTPAPVITTVVTTVASTTHDPFWDENKAKIESELAHLKAYMASVLKDAQPLIKEMKRESMGLMIDSIMAEIKKIESFESIIADAMKKVTKLADKFFLENSAQTLALDKQELNELLNELNNALASTATPAIDPHGNP